MKNQPLCHRWPMILATETDKYQEYHCRFCSHKKVIKFTPQQLGGRAVVKKYGRDYMAKIGQKGFKSTTDKYFDGDREAHTKWLAQAGLWAGDESYRAAGFGVFGWPGYHPGQQEIPF